MSEEALSVWNVEVIGCVAVWALEQTNSTFSLKCNLEREVECTSTARVPECPTVGSGLSVQVPGVAWRRV
jgi:hypothetical protein